MSDEHLSRKWSSCRAKWLFATVTASFAAFVAGCTMPRPSPNVETDSIVVEAKFIDTKGDPISVDNRPTDSSLTLGAIAGAITGKPTRTLQVVRIAKLSAVEINLDSFAAAVVKQAAPMTPGSADSGLHIDPIDTRFARASTLLNYSGALPGNLFMGFVDPDSKNPLTLVYFDRPCRLTGVTAIANTGSEKLTLVYDVTVEKPGLNWLVRTPKGP